MGYQYHLQLLSYSLKKPKRWQEQIILLIITAIQSKLYFLIQLGN